MLSSYITDQELISLKIDSDIFIPPVDCFVQNQHKRSFVNS